MGQDIRTFIAIELGPAVRQELLDIQRQLRHCLTDNDTVAAPHTIGRHSNKNKISRGIKWVEPDNIHLTLKFLGDTPVDQIDAIKAALERTAQVYPAFQIAIQGLGAFPNTRFPKIIWIGVEEGTDRLVNLVQSLETNLTGIRFAKAGDASASKEFAAHITLGRIRWLSAQMPWAETFATLPMKNPLIQKVAKLTLYKSQITGQGPIYSTIATIPLAPAQAG